MRAVVLHEVAMEATGSRREEIQLLARREYVATLSHPQVQEGLDVRREGWAGGGACGLSHVELFPSTAPAHVLPAVLCCLLPLSGGSAGCPAAEVRVHVIVTTALQYSQQLVRRHVR